MTMRSVANQVIYNAGAAGGLDEVAAIAARGWPESVVVQTIRSSTYADRDDSLDAARQDLASDLGCEAWELTAEWDDPTERGAIIVRATARALLDAIREVAIGKITEVMADEMRKSFSAGSYRQYESVMRARWGRNFVPKAFARAADELDARESASALAARPTDPGTQVPADEP